MQLWAGFSGLVPANSTIVASGTMTRIALPGQILLLVSAAFIAVQVLLWLSINSVRDTMNVNAAEESRQRLEGRLRSMQEQVSVIASDYHNWTDVFLSTQQQDFERLASNYGITAERGDVFQYAELFDGPFDTIVAWREGQGMAPQEGFLTELTRNSLRNLVTTLDIKQRDTINFFEVREGAVVIFSASYMLPEDEEILSKIDIRDQAIAVIGQMVTRDRLAQISAEFSLKALKIVQMPEMTTTVSVPLIGILDEPVAWLEWLPPKPGNKFFNNIAPIMGGISLIFACAFLFGAILLRKKANELITQEALSYQQARTDSLTSIPNRLALQEHLQNLAEGGARNVAAIVIDIDNFKGINDVAGHLGGDTFLKQLGSRLISLIDDQTFIARLSGDEFIIVLSSENDIETLFDEKSDDLCRISEKPIPSSGILFDVMLAKGGTIMKSDYYDINELLRRADRALYVGKARATQQVIKFDKAMEEADRKSKAMENILRRTLATGEGLSIAYQPIVVSRKPEKIFRYEALARWTSTEFGQVSPDEFIKLAESSGLINRLGWRLLDLICCDIKGLTNCRFGVNISPIQLMTPGFANKFFDRVQKHGVSPEQIEVEVTEQIVLSDEKKVHHELMSLRSHGFSLALDDFGTGFASISYVTRMPFSVLKIDRSFAKIEMTNANSMRLLSSIIGLAHSMDLHVVAEGIETAENAERFRNLGADFLQGYHFARPGPLHEIKELASQSG